MGNIEQLYRMYFKDVYLYLRAITKNQDLAEELTQETFFKALKGIGKFRGECDVRVWLCQIAKNTYFAHYNQSKKFDSVESQDLQSEENIEEIFIQKEFSQNALACLHKLEEPYKEVFMLSVFGGFSFKDISTLFGKSESWARVTFYRAKQKLSERIK